MQIKPIHGIFGLLLIGTAVPSLSGLGQLSSEVNAARTEAKRIGQETTELKLSQQEADQKSVIANERYQEGCLPVVSPDQRSYVSLVLNQPVVDSASGVPLPVGSVVCDAHGNTGVITDDDGDPNTYGLVQKMAFTGDKNIIDAHLRNYKGALYSMPQN